TGGLGSNINVRAQVLTISIAQCVESQIKNRRLKTKNIGEQLSGLNML
ncbi:hypothetical protein O763_01134, partial [Staphylococcus aureus M0456]